MKMPNLLACLAATWLVGDLAMADISITGGRMANPGRHPFKDSETIGAFIERIGGIKPTVYQGVEKPFPYPITSLRILRDRLWSDTYSLKRDATHLWNHELKDGDLIELLTVSMFADEGARKWQGAYRDDWTIRVPKEPDQVKDKAFPWSLFNTEAGYRRVLMEAFPGLELGCYHFSGERMMGVLEDFDHDRVLLLINPGASETVRGVMINGKEFDYARAVPVGVKVFGMSCGADGEWADDPTRIDEEPIGHWIPMESTDRFAVRIQSLIPDRGLFVASYDPDRGWHSSYELSDAEEPKEVKPPADAYELTRKSLIARVLQVLEKKPECVVRKQNDIDLKLARPPEGFWEDEVEPMLVILADRILVGSGGASKELDPSQLQRYFEMYLSAAISAQAAPRVLVQVGKHATDARFRDFLAAIRATHLRLVYLASDPHGAFLGCGASEQPVLKQLEAITVPEIDLPKQLFSAALDSLQQRYSNGKSGGVINFIVRGPANGPPAVSGSDRAENSVSLQAKNLSFAGAIDALCVQAGCEWWLESNTESPPLLVIRRRNEQQKP
jgi:hypothetical protein